MRAILVATVLAAQALLTLDGKPFSLDALTSKTAVVVFWNSWVPQDPQFVPLVLEFEGKLAAKGFAGAVVIFQEEDAAEVAVALGPARPWPRVVDRRGTLLRQLGVSRAPVVAVLAPGGEVRAVVGPDVASVRQLLETLTRP
ncbi:MAG: TlpA family protein disulfide reductase [Thermoanaerobaculum sp.]